MIQVVWVEIPVEDLRRAKAFYRQLFDLPDTEEVNDGTRSTTTLFQNPQSGGPGLSLNQTANFKPSDKGPLIYLSTGDDLNLTLSKVEAAGGKIVETKTSMGTAGDYATFLDTEGNLLALYSYEASS